VVTRAGKRMPVDVGRPTVVVTDDGDTVSGYPSHFGTCPKAQEFRKPKATQRDMFARPDDPTTTRSIDPT
jgi:hypothetical protein